tara:strand:+ start:2725 stop:2913 length:189 start_codon:yes stop_codon:yes gene_type:complete
MSKDKCCGQGCCNHSVPPEDYVTKNEFEVAPPRRDKNGRTALQRIFTEEMKRISDKLRKTGK